MNVHRVHALSMRLVFGMLATLGAFGGLPVLAQQQGPAFGPPPQTLPPPRTAPNQLPPPPTPSPVAGPEALPSANPSSPNVADVRVEGVPNSRLKQVAQQVRTRRGRPFIPEQVEEDVRRLISTRKYVDVDTSYQNTPNGEIIVIFKLVERPTIEYVKYIGNKVRSHVLAKKSGLKEGMAKDPYSVDEARRKIEEYYQEKGYSRVQVTVMEGDRPEDPGVVFLINEGGKQKVWNTHFEGNSIVSDGRLRTQIETSRPVLWIFGGSVKRATIDEDIQRLEAYYRSMGFFNARVGRRLDYDEDNKWLTVTFAIDEGPQYVVRNVSVVGNTKFAEQDLKQDFMLLPGQYFNQKKMNHDVADLQDKYGAQGYVFAAVEATPTFSDEQQGVLDLVYRLEEGERYRVGRIDPIIKGEHPHTRLNTVLNRISIRPGDIMDLRELRNSERRLKASGLFTVDPAQGEPPKIVFKQPDIDDTMVAEKPPKDGNFRGQSPDVTNQPPPVLFYFPSRALREAQGGASSNEPFVIRVPHVAPRPYTPPRPVATPLQTRPAPQKPRQQQPQTSTQPPLGRRPGETVFRGQSPDGTQWGQARPGYSGTPLVAQRQPAPSNGGYPNTGQPPVYTAQQPNGGYQPPYATTNTQGQPYAAPGYAPQFAPPPSGPPVYNLPPGEVTPGPQPGMGMMGGPPDAGMGAFNPNDPMYGGGDPVPPPQLPTLPLIPTVEETQTGRLMFGVGVNSNAGVVGNIVIDERNFDIFRVPKSWEEIRNFTAFRGGGQQFRIEAVPGNQLQRYMITFREPYLFDSLVSFGVSGFLFTRQFYGWNEDRVGGKVSFGYQFPYRPDLSTTLSLGGQNVEIHNPRYPSPQSVQDVLGDNALYTARLALTHDTRDSAFLATEGHMWEIAYEQAFGDFVYPRGTIEAKQYFHTMERADGSGRHVLSFTGQVGLSGDETPVFENFYAGGFSTIRGFDFRGASPREYNVPIGGRLMVLGSAEYMVPLTPDDMLRAVVFVDAGTVEQDIEINEENFRVATGFGLRITVPALGPAPIALDLAVPLHHAGGDDIQNFAFFMGFAR